jgi:hypothetical protein
MIQTHNLVHAGLPLSQLRYAGPFCSLEVEYSVAYQPFGALLLPLHALAYS